MKHRAQVIFIERLHVEGDPGLPGWTGKLLNPNAIDEVTGKRASNVIMRIDYAQPYGSHDGYGEDAEYIGTVGTTKLYKTYPYTVTVQGHSKYARRRYHFPTIDEAQAYIAAWARRRFYIEGDGR